MGAWIADTLHARRGGQPGSALVLGLTFKENVPDLRNSRSFDLVHRLTELGHKVDVADPLVQPAELERDHGLALTDPEGRRYDIVIGAVSHDQYRAMTGAELNALLAPGGTIADLKGIWRELALDPDSVWTL